MENNTQENLIAKKINLLSAIKNVSKKSLIAVMLASMLATTPACTPRDNDPNTNENGNENNNQNNNGSGQNGGSENNKYSVYSKLLQGVLTNQDYNQLIEKYQDYTTDILNHIHPFGFLEDEGYDISAIKSGQLDCRTNPFVKKVEPNNLYMAVAVKDGNYYSNYLLKYELTDQEMNEYLSFSGGRYSTYQAYFMNDAISRSKNVTVLSETTINSNLFNYCNSIDFNSTVYSEVCDDILKDEDDSVLTIITDFDEETNKINTIIIPKLKSSTGIALREYNVGELEFEMRFSSFSVVVENNILVGPTALGNLAKITSTGCKDSYIPTYSKAGKLAVSDLRNNDNDYNVSSYN
ncbi:MAG: hypothetical protein IKC49_03765 [Clostridia bacterium]|nr:hypothetical protein [Clostridia bacterium]